MEDVAGQSASEAGIVMFAGQIADALATPLAGLSSDLTPVSGSYSTHSSREMEVEKVSSHQSLRLSFNRALLGVEVPHALDLVKPFI